MSKEVKSFFAGSIAFTFLAVMRNIIPLHNMEFFVAACAAFVCVTILSYIAFQKKGNVESPAGGRIGSILAIALLAAWMILFYVNETNTEHSLNTSELIRRYFPFPLWIVLMILGVAACLFLLRREPQEKTLKIRKKIRAATAIVFTCGTSIQFYAPNIFRDIQGGTFHSHAYTNSIINICWLIPYGEDMESLYGHYAILYMPVLKLLHKFFHVDYLTGIFAVSAVIAGVSILLFLYVLDYFSQNDLIFYLGMFAIGEEYFMLMQGGVYLQVHPHRMIFPVLFMVFALQEYKTGKKHSVLAVILLVLSFVWSTEVGIVTMLSFALYRWVLSVMDGEAFSLRKVLLLVRVTAVYVLLPFALSYLLINGYNLLAGGTILEFGEFMFPLISDRGYIEKIELALPNATHAWVGTSILFLGAVCPAMFKVLFPDKDEKKLEPFYFFLGVMSIGLMLYYVNRPVEGSIFIVLFPMLIWQAVILQKSQNVYLDWKKEKSAIFTVPDRFVFLSLRVVTTFILFIMAFDCIYSMPKAWKTSSETIWKKDELMEFAQYVYVQIPPDAAAFGEGVPELMALIDRDTHVHTTEWSFSNMPLDTMERIRHDLEKTPYFFCSLASLWYMQEEYPGLTDQFYLHEEFEYNGVKFGFFRANES